MPYIANRPVLSGVLQNFVESGGVITNPGTTQIAFTTPIVYWIAGVRYVASPGTATATVSKDNYVYIDVTGTITVTPNTTNAASPALPANSILLGIGIWGVATASSINQGDPFTVAPVVSSRTLGVVDTNGVQIYPTSPTSNLIGWAQVQASQTGITTITDLTGLTSPCIIPAGRHIEIGYSSVVAESTTSDGIQINIREGSTTFKIAVVTSPLGTANMSMYDSVPLSPTSGLHTYKISMSNVTGGTVTTSAGSTFPAIFWVKLV